jgi:hypothetical protein
MRGDIDTLKRLLDMGRQHDAVVLLRSQSPVDAYGLIKRLLVIGSVDGPTAIDLINHSIPRDCWNELGISSIGFE